MVTGIFNPLTSPWLQNDQDIWLASSICLERNMKNSCFPGKLNPDEKVRIRELLKSALLDTPSFANGIYIDGDKLTPYQKDYLYEHFLSPLPLQSLHKGEGVLYNQEGSKFCLLNHVNHLHLLCIEPSEDLFDMWKHVVDLELGIENEMSFAFNPRFGFLTAQPSHCGLGLSIRTILQVPASILSHTIRAYLSNENSPVVVEGIDGHPHRFIGDLVVIRNRYSLGIKEENILSHIHKLATKLAVQERSLREKFSRDFDIKVFDQIGRALGLLKYSYSLDMGEALDALSKLRLGMDLGWIKGIQHRDITRMHFSCQRGHLKLQVEEGAVLDPKQVNEARAHFFRKELNKITMKDMP